MIKHYDKNYFNWQKSIGEFGGIANLYKFEDYITDADTVLDFGCGGGYLLKNIIAKEKVGLDVSSAAIQEAKNKNQINAVQHIQELPDDHFDIIISNHALEHIENPLQTIKDLRFKLRKNGKAVFVVPHEDTRGEFKDGDINMHLYTWNQMTLGNLFKVAGYSVKKVDKIQFQWKPEFAKIIEDDGWSRFNDVCRELAIKNNNFQIRIIAENI